MKYKLLSIKNKIDIPFEYRNTPVGLLLEYHNLNRHFDTYSKAEMLIGMCMDNRNQLRTPANFAFIIRAGGTNLGLCDFYVSYAIGVGDIKYIALVTHNDCGMVNLESKKERFIAGLVKNAGWEINKAEEYFKSNFNDFEILNEIEFITNQTEVFRKKYPKIKTVPLYYNVNDFKLYCIIKQ